MRFKFCLNSICNSDSKIIRPTAKTCCLLSLLPVVTCSVGCNLSSDPTPVWFFCNTCPRFVFPWPVQGLGGGPAVEGVPWPESSPIRDFTGSEKHRSESTWERVAVRRGCSGWVPLLCASVIVGICSPAPIGLLQQHDGWWKKSRWQNDSHTNPRRKRYGEQHPAVPFSSLRKSVRGPGAASGRQRAVTCYCRMGPLLLAWLTISHTRGFVCLGMMVSLHYFLTELEPLGWSKPSPAPSPAMRRGLKLFCSLSTNASVWHASPQAPASVFKVF